MSARILVVEDEEALRLALVDALVAEGYAVLEAADGERALELALQEGPELVLLDLVLPGLDGLSVLRRLREDRLGAGVLILTARGEEWDRVRGLELGADDYLVKPVSIRELLLRVRAVLARLAGDAPGIEGVAGRLVVGAARVDFAAHDLERDGVRTNLSRIELDLLRFLLAHEGQVVSRARILTGVWGAGAAPSERTIDMHVMKLRRKLEPEPERPRFLTTVHGVGYRLVRRGEQA